MAARGPKVALARPFGDTLDDAFPFILALVKEGHFIAHACELAGFTSEGLRQYRQLHPDADTQLAMARAAVAGKVLKLVMDYAEKDPATARWWLEKLRPEEYGRRDKVEVTGKDGEAIQVEAFRRMSDDELLKIATGKVTAGALPESGGGDGDG